MDFKKGDTVRFANPTESEKGDRFEVVELRGDRVLVRDANPFWNDRAIRPTAVYLIADLVKVDK